MNMSENPLLQPFRTPRETVPFDQIRNEHFLPALEAALSAGRREVDAIAGSPEPPTFDNTLVALERSGELVSRVSSVMYNLNHAETNPGLQKIVRDASPLLTEYGNDITLNEALFARIKAVYEGRHGLNLDAEDAMLLERTYKSFARNGANLSPQAKERFREIDKELARLALEFGEHILNETNEYVLTLTDEADLAGLPEFVREMARQVAQQKGREGWAFTLQAPSYVPFMQYADNRDLRQQLFMAYNSRGYHGDQNDNQEVPAKHRNAALRTGGAAGLAHPRRLRARRKHGGLGRQGDRVLAGPGGARQAQGAGATGRPDGLRPGQRLRRRKAPAVGLQLLRRKTQKGTVFARRRNAQAILRAGQRAGGHLHGGRQTLRPHL
jgi:Zn-dependent oligopeptidase